jgi:hypothetical protein
MDLFTHLYAILGITIRLPEIEPEGQSSLFKNAITILKRAEHVGEQGTPPAAEVREKISFMRTQFIEWRKQDFAFQAAEQRAIIATSVELAGENDFSDL